MSWDISPQLPDLTFNLYRRESFAHSFILLNRAPLVQPTFLDQSVISGRRYQYQLQVMKGNTMIAFAETEVATDDEDNLQALTVYPNPFNERSFVRFVMPSAGKPLLELVDINGRLVRTLESSVLEAGVHSRQLSSCDLASGIYFIRFKHWNEDGTLMINEVSKMTVLK